MYDKYMVWLILPGKAKTMNCDRVARIVTIIAALTCIAACSTDEPPEPVDQTLAGTFRLVKVDTEEPADLGGPNERFKPGLIKESYSHPEITGRMILDGDIIRMDALMPKERIELLGTWSSEISGGRDYLGFNYFNTVRNSSMFTSLRRYTWQGNILKIHFGAYSTGVRYIMYWEKLSNR